MNAPAAIVPPYRHTPLFPLGKDTSPYRKLTAEGVRVERMMGDDMLLVEREALRALAEAAFTDINHLLRPGHLKQLRSILDDPEASDNDKFVAYDFLKNANIAAGGVLPMCQDTGTAIIMGKKGRLVFTDGDDEAALAEGASQGYASGAFGPTTAGRMDSFVGDFQAAGGSMVMLAKGNRSAAVRDACHKHGGFYLASIGGAAANLAEHCIKKVETVEYPELGMEAIWRIEVENFPAFIVIDDKGNDFFKELNLG